MFLIPHLGTIIWTTLIFGIVFFILKKFAWAPLLKALDDREQSIDNALKSAEAAESKLSSLKEEQQLIINVARKEKEQLVKQGIEQREQIVVQAKEKAQAEADKIIEEARKKIVREREAALIEMKNQIAALSIEIATKVVQADMQDKKRHEKLVEDLVKDIELN